MSNENVDRSIEKMTGHLKAAAGRWSENLAVCYPVTGNNGAPEQNLTTFLAHELLEDEDGWNVWMEFEFAGEGEKRGPKGHIDCLAYDMGNKVLWTIETKRLHNTDTAGSIVGDHDRMSLFKWKRDNEATTPVEGQAGLVVASLWDDDEKWWTEETEKRPPRGRQSLSSWLNLAEKLNATGVVRGSKKLGKFGGYEEYFCWAIWPDLGAM